MRTLNDAVYGRQGRGEARGPFKKGIRKSLKERDLTLFEGVRPLSFNPGRGGRPKKKGVERSQVQPARFNVQNN